MKKFFVLLALNILLISAGSAIAAIPAVTVSPSDLTMTVGETATVTINATPANDGIIVEYGVSGVTWAFVSGNTVTFMPLSAGNFTVAVSATEEWDTAGHMIPGRATGTAEVRITVTEAIVPLEKVDVPDNILNRILSVFSGISESDIYNLDDNELLYTWEISNNDLDSISKNNEQVALKLPIMMPSKTGIYIIKCVLTDAKAGVKLNLYRITEGNGNFRSAAVSYLEYSLLDENGNETEILPKDKTIYAAMRLDAGTSNGGILTVPKELQTGMVEPLETEEISDELIEKIADVISIEPEQIQFIKDENITTTEEPTEAMRREASRNNMQFVGKMDTLTVSQDGYYVMRVTLSDELYEQLKNVKVSELRAYALRDDGDETAQGTSVMAAIVYGFLNTWELLTLTGDKMEFTLKTFLVAGFLEAGQPFTVYLLRIVLMLLAGCNANTGLAGLAVLGGSFIALKAFRNRKRD